ncbi:MAG: hypothetical protein DMG15_24305 [Acidobacteria bacterium]|nr:MAG: hypothetical protein DMG15_24305 [Acidobacteriota bacterium]
MSKATKILIAAGFVALLGFIIYSTMGLAKIKCEVCVEFHGRTFCGLAAGTTREEAVKSAVSVACSDLAAGRTENIACESTRPKTMTCK